MTLRTRLVALTASAVALAILAVSITLWLLIRSSLLQDVDNRLHERMENANRIVQLAAQRPVIRGAGVAGDERVALQGDPIGAQVLAPDGEVTERIAPGDIDIRLEPEELELLAGQQDDVLFRTVTVDHESYRVATVALPDGHALRLIQPLDRVESTMARIAWLLAGVAGVGVAVAGGLGWLTTSAGLRPVDRLVAAAEQVATTKDLAHRIQIDGSGRGEVARLAEAVNAMLSALEEARAQQRELVENAGHELRTPLATLRNDLSLLVRVEQEGGRGLSSTERAQLLRDVEVEADGLSELVAEVIDLARGDRELESPLEVDVHALVERAVARARRAHPSVPVEVRGVTVHAVILPAGLERAVVNLVRNALQVSPPREVVEVTVEARDGWIGIEVSDRGPGLTDAELPKVFQRFYRGDGARERHGSGLGLAIVAQVAAQHGGAAEAANRPGGGATFILRVPQRPATGKSTQRS